MWFTCLSTWQRGFFFFKKNILTVTSYALIILIFDLGLDLELKSLLLMWLRVLKKKAFQLIDIKVYLFTNSLSEERKESVYWLTGSVFLRGWLVTV